MSDGQRYRVGRKLGRTIYRDEVLIGVMDRAEDAALIVELLNSAGDGGVEPWVICSSQGELRAYVDSDEQQHFRAGLTAETTPIGWRALYAGEASPA